MNYDELTRDEASIEIMNQVGQKTYDEHKNEIIEPSDVLYWLDAFGGLSLAINCQGLPKDLPDEVVKTIDEYDVFNGWHGNIKESNCPICNTDFYEFDFDVIYPVIDEWGDNHEYIEHVSDPAGYYWNAVGEEHLMCQHCRDSPNFSRMRPEPVSGEVRVFYGESDEFSRFSHQSGVIRWDFEWDMDDEKATDLYNLHSKDDELVRGTEIAKAFAEGNSSRDAMMARLGFERIHVKEIDQNVKGLRRFWRYAEEVLVKWASINHGDEPTRPDLPFTYIIEGRYQAWVPTGCFAKFRAELVWQALREASDYDRAEQYRKKYDKFLSFDWEAA